MPDLMELCVAAAEAAEGDEQVEGFAEERFEGEVSELGGAVVIAFPGRSVSVVSEWVPGEPVWHGTLDGVKVAALSGGVGGARRLLRRLLAFRAA